VACCARKTRSLTKKYSYRFRRLISWIFLGFFLLLLAPEFPLVSSLTFSHSLFRGGSFLPHPGHEAASTGWKKTRREWREGGTKKRGGERVLFKRAQSQEPAELAKALETALSSSVVSVRLFFVLHRPSFSSVVLLNQCFVTSYKTVSPSLPSFLPLSLSRSLFRLFAVK